MKTDPINPSHYRSHPSGVEAIEILEHLPYNIASAMKYLWRCGLKETAQPEEDLEGRMVCEEGTEKTKTKGK